MDNEQDKTPIKESAPESETGSKQDLREKRRFTEYLSIGLKAVSVTFQRFPVTLLSFLALAVTIIYRIEVPYYQWQDFSVLLDRLSAIFALGVLLSLSVALLLEKFRPQSGFLAKLGSYLGQALLLYLYFLLLMPDNGQVAIIRLIMIMIALFLSFFFIPYLKGKENLEIYVTRIITHLAATAFYTIVLALGVMAILFAIKSLLYADLNDNLYAETWIVALMVFAPLHFLHSLPEAGDIFTVAHFNKIIKIMLIYILLPIISVYTAVLYIYFAKIIITQEWPKGIVSYLVVSYAAVGTLAIFLTAPFKSALKWVKVFTASFTKLIFPLLAMMFIAIGLRINQFGFTENRYMIVVIGIWVVIAMIFLNFYRGKKSTFLPISLAVIALLTVIGPWSAFQVSVHSQSQRFYEIVSKYDMIENNVVIKNTLPVADNDQREISAIVQYFEQAHQTADLKYLPADFDINKFESLFGFPLAAYYDPGQNSYFNYYQENTGSLIIGGYDLLFPMQGYSGSGDNLFDQQLLTDKGMVRVVLDNQFILTVYRDGKEIYKDGFTAYVRTLYDKYGTNAYADDDPKGLNGTLQGDLILKKETDKVKLMFVFQNIGGNYNASSDSLQIDSLSGSLFLTVK